MVSYIWKKTSIISCFLGNIDVNLIEVAHSTLQPVYVFALEVKKSSLLGSVHFWKMDYFDNYLSVDQYLLGIFKGQMMGFTLPKTVKWLYNM